jgi:hypothetical protein
VLRTVLLAGALAVVASTVSHFLAPRYASRASVADQQLAILERRPFVEPGGRAGDVPEFRNRILVPAALAATITITRLSPVTAYFAVRVACAFAMFLLVGWYVSRQMPPAALLPALAVLALCLVISFNHPYEFPSDYLDVLFTTIFVVAARSRGRLLALIAAAIGATARESAAFSGVIWWFCAADPPARRAAYAGLLALVAMAVTTGMRVIFHLPGASIFNSIAIQGSAGTITRTFVTDPGPRIWIIGIGVMAVLLYYWLETAREWTSSDPRTIKAAAVVLVVTLVFGVIHELRIYMPVITCVLLAGVSPHPITGVIADRPSAGSTAPVTTPQSASR